MTRRTRAGASPARTLLRTNQHRVSDRVRAGLAPALGSSRFYKQTPQHFADEVPGQFGAKFDAVRNFVGVEAFAAEGQQFFRGGLFAAFEYHYRFDKGGGVFAVGAV